MRTWLPVALFPLALAALLEASPARAEGEIRLTAQPVDPSPVPYAATALGRATHRVHVVLSNPSNQRATLEGATFRWSAFRDGVTYPCEDRTDPNARSDIRLQPGRSIALEAVVSCETPLPGDYDVELSVIGSGGVSASRRFVVSVGGGENAPLRLPGDARAWFAAAMTREAWPSHNQPTGARVAVAVINGSKETLGLAPLLMRLRTTVRGSGKRACVDQIVPISTRGEVAPGRVQPTWIPLDCRIKEAGLYDVHVSISSESAPAPRSIGKLVLRVRTGPPSGAHPFGEQLGSSQFRGGGF
jgi:hypothetical protein